VAKICAHEDESIWVGRRASKTAKVTDGMTGCAEEIERAVSEEVIRRYLAGLRRKVVQGYLFEFAIPKKFDQYDGMINAIERLFFKADLKYLSSIKESGSVGWPGRKFSLKPGPTTRLTDVGKSEGSPMWSKCQ
jgi:hypothetical protein